MSSLSEARRTPAEEVSEQFLEGTGSAEAGVADPLSELPTKMTVGGSGMRVRDILAVCETHGNISQISGSLRMELEVCGLCFLHDGSQVHSVQPGQAVLVFSSSPDSLENVSALSEVLSEKGAAVLLVLMPADETASWQCQDVRVAAETPIVLVSVPHDRLFCLMPHLLRLFPAQVASSPPLLPENLRHGRGERGVAALQDIANELAVRTSAVVTIKDTEFDVLAFGASPKAGHPARLPCRVSPEAVDFMRKSGLLAQVDRTTVPLRLPPLASAGLGSRVVMPIRGADKEVLGYIRITEVQPDEGAEESFRDDIERAAQKAGIPMMYRKAARNAQESAIWALLGSLFAGPVDSDHWARTRLKALGCEPLPYSFVMVLSADPVYRTDYEEDRLASREAEICRQHLGVYQGLEPVLAKCCRNGYGLARVGEMVEVLVMWKDFLDEQDIRKLTSNIYSNIASSIYRRASELKLSAGVGGLTQHLNALFRSHQEAVAAVEIGRALWGPGRLTFADDLGLLRVLSRKGETPGFGQAFTRFWGVLEEYDSRHGTELSRTVATFLDCLGSVRRSAKSLYVHPNTVLYRLRKAQRLTAMALSDPNLRMLIHLELKLRQIMQRGARVNSAGGPTLQREPVIKSEEP